MTEVLIVGAGPAGLLLACELRLAGVGTVLIERHATRPGFCRSFTLNARSLDLLGRRGLAAGLVAEGWTVPHAPFAGLPVTLGLEGAATGHPYTLGIPQTRVEEVLEERAAALGADIRRGHELRALDADGTATVTTGGGDYRVRAEFVAGCDGGRSTVRRQAGIPFPGTAATRFSLLGDVEPTDPEELPYGVSTGPGGAVFVIPRPGHVRIVVTDPQPPADKDTPVTLDELSAAVEHALGRRPGLREPRWLTRFGDAARQATEYVRGRVVLAGDAAHIHPPAGAIGINVALDDAFNLGWKLAATIRGTAPPGLLGTYHAERHAAGARVLAQTRAAALLGDPDEPRTALLTRVAAHPSGNRALAEILTGLDTRYDVGPDGGHPWLGRLAPDLALSTGPLSALLAAGRGVLLAPPGSEDLSRAVQGRRDRVDVVTAACPAHPELRGLLLRPDGHVAWIRTGDAEPLEAALTRWFGRRGR